MNNINIRCPRCGIVHNCNFCPNCGLQAPPPPPPINNGYTDQFYTNVPNQKKGMNGCLIAALTMFITFIFIGFVALGIYAIVPSPNNTVNKAADISSTPSPSSPPTDEEVRTALLEFDSKSWDQFKALYISHNNMMKAVSLYSDNSISSLDFYTYCKDFKKYFQDMSSNFDWGKTEDEKMYLKTFEVFALADQQAAEYLIKYVDSGKTSDLSKAQEAIERAKEAATTIASNRGTLLVKAGLTDEELHEKVEADMAQLEEEMNK